MVEYMNVYMGHSRGVLSLAAGVLQWRSKSSESYKKIAKDDVVSVVWSEVGKHCHLKVFQTGGKMILFNGLRREDITELEAQVSASLDQPLSEEHISSAGGNWGTFSFEGQQLNFRTPEREHEGEDHKSKSSILSFPLEDIAQCAVPSKNELEIHFHEDDTVAADEETLVDMRMYVPPGVSLEDLEADPDTLTGAQEFKNQILDRANITSFTGQSIVELDEQVGTFLTPRGRYAIELYTTFLRMHGKTYDYKIMYSNINRCFLLERPDGISCAFVISLEDPIRQGKQSYPHLVLQLKKEESDISVQLSPEKLEAYKGNLAEHMTGQLPQLVATIFKYLLEKKVRLTYFVIFIFCDIHRCWKKGLHVRKVSHAYGRSCNQVCAQGSRRTALSTRKVIYVYSQTHEFYPI